MTQLAEKSDTRIAQRIKESLAATKGNLEDDNNLAFVWGALKRVPREMLMLTMNDLEVRVASGAAMIQMTTSATMVRATAKTFVTEEAIIALIARFAVSQIRKSVSEAV